MKDKDNKKKNTVSKKKTTVNKKNNEILEQFKAFINKDFGKFKGIHVIGGLFILLVLILLIVLFGNHKEEYPSYAMVYQNSDGELVLLDNKAKEGKKLSSNDSTSDVIYANNTDRYILFMKNSSLYLYDAKHKDDTVKLVSDVKEYTFTENDKYVVATDEEDNLYSYNFKKDKEKLDSDISSVKAISDDYVVYVKEDSLYIKSLNVKKDDREKITNEYGASATISKDGKKVLYLDSENDLKSYNIKSKDNDKVASDVYEFYCDDSCNKMYYIVYDETYTLYYYNGKESTKIAEDIYEISDVDVDEKQVVYAKYDEDKYTLYYQSFDKDAVKLENDLSEMVYVNIFKGKEIYYVNNDGKVRYAKIKGAKLGDVTTIAEDILDYLKPYNDGYIFVADTDKNSNGDLYFAKNGKAKKIDTDVYSSYIEVSTNGKKVFYLKNYSSNSGDLYSTTGGKGKKIDSDVYKYQYIGDKLVYYLKDYSSSKKRGDLYRYTGSKGKKVVEDVSSMASNPNYFQLKK